MTTNVTSSTTAPIQPVATSESFDHGEALAASSRLSHGLAHHRAIPRLRRRSTALWLHLVFLLLLIAAATLTLVGSRTGDSPFGRSVTLGGMFGIFVVASAWAVSAVLAQAVLGSGRDAERRLTALDERVHELGIMLTLVSEQQLLSDRTKMIAFRVKERDTIRRAIEEEIARQDFEAAGALANDFETSFGYRQEADRYRLEIADRQGELLRRQMDEATTVVDRLCRGEQWVQARHEATRLAQLFSREPRMQRLPAEVDMRREQFKQQLLQRWRQAVAGKDLDGSIDLLKQLDVYLTPAEAEGLQDDARSVVNEKIGLLREQFSRAVQAHEWPAALRAAESIVADFPESRLADELRDMMDVLQQRASGLQPVRV